MIVDRLPNAQHALVSEEKVTDYLLSVDHPSGKGKAEFFFNFGFRIQNWEEFADALRSHCIRGEVVRTERTDYGVKYIVDGIIETPDGRNPYIRAIWQVDKGGDYPRIITARPIRRR